LAGDLFAAGYRFNRRRGSLFSFAQSHRSRFFIGARITYLHSSAATALLGLLAWYEAPGAWLAAVWAVFALVLALVDREFELQDLGWQHTHSLLSQCFAVSL